MAPNPLLDPELAPTETPLPEEQPEQNGQAIDLGDLIEQPRSVVEPVKKPPATPPNPELEQKKQQKLQEELGRFKSGQQKVAGQAAKTGEQTVANALKQRVGQAGERAGQQAARAAGQAAKKAGQAAARATTQLVQKVVTALVADNPVILLVVGIILLVIIVVGVVFVLFSLSGNQGKGPAIYATTQVEAQQATLLGALTGDKLNKLNVVKEVVQDEKDRYTRIEKAASQFTPDLASQVKSKAAEFNPLLDSLVNEPTKEGRIKIRDELEKKMLSFEATLPFGTWITRYALGHLNQKSVKFCVLTGASAGTACASFVSTVLWEAGVPNAIVPTTTQVWQNKGLRVVVDRPKSKSSKTWDDNQKNLQPGDVIWWGDGSCSSVSYSGKLFDHIGIYVGDGQAVDNSSSAKQILKRPGKSRSGCELFNGAKRYGKN